VQAIAAWLVARPMHAVLGLALTLMLPFAQVFSGAVMVTLVLLGGARKAALQGLAAMVVLALLSVLGGRTAPEMLVSGIVAWLPVFLLAWLLRSSRSLTLTMQVSAIVAMLVTLGFYAVVPDPIAYWTALLTDVAILFRDMGLVDQAALIVAQQDLIAPQMTMLMVLVSWSMVTLVVVLGYAIYQALPDRKGEFGQFGDLNFGRVLALVMAVTSALALAIDAEWLRNFAFVVFVIFWLQGLAVLHWLQANVPLPFVVLLVVYGMLPFLNALLILALAVLGYTDAWFNYRARIAKNRAH
jgi:hypothetical protein